MRILMVLLFLSGAAQAQVVTDMTPERIEQALADDKTPGCYPLGSKGAGVGLREEISNGCFTTPYSRVAGAAQEARRTYQKFSAANVDEAMLAPVVEVVAFPVPSFIMGRGKVGPPLDVKAVVIMPRKSKDRSAAVLPTVETEVERGYQNLYGATFEAKGIRAFFPLSVLSESNEIRFVYVGLGCSDWKNKLSSECNVRLKLEGVK